MILVPFQELKKSLGIQTSMTDCLKVCSKHWFEKLVTTSICSLHTWKGSQNLCSNTKIPARADLFLGGLINFTGTVWGQETSEVLIVLFFSEDSHSSGFHSSLFFYPDTHCNLLLLKSSATGKWGILKHLVHQLFELVSDRSDSLEAVVLWKHTYHTSVTVLHSGQCLQM